MYLYINFLYINIHIYIYIYIYKFIYCKILFRYISLLLKVNLLFSDLYRYFTAEGKLKLISKPFTLNTTIRLMDVTAQKRQEETEDAYIHFIFVYYQTVYLNNA